MYDVIDPSSCVLGSVVYFPLYHQMRDLWTFKCTPMTNRMRTPSLANVVKQPGLQLSDLWWWWAFPTRCYGIVLIFLSDSSLVSAGPLHTVSVVLSDTPQIELSPFPGLIKKSTLSILWLRWRVTVWSTAFTTVTTRSLPSPSLALPRNDSLCFILRGPQLEWGLPGYHFLSHPLLKNGLFFPWWRQLLS